MAVYHLGLERHSRDWRIRVDGYAWRTTVHTVTDSQAVVMVMHRRDVDDVHPGVSGSPSDVLQVLQA